MKHWYVGLIIPLVAIIPIGIYFFRRKIVGKGPKLIAIYLAVSLGTNAFGRLLGMAHINNLPLLHLYTITEFLMLMCYFRAYELNKRMIVLMTILMIVFPIYSLLNMFVIQGPFIFNSYTRPISAIFIMVMSFYRIYKNLGYTDRFTNYFSNWISIGLLVYFGSGLFQFALSNIIYTRISLQQQFILGSVYANLVLTMYLLFIGGFIYADQQ